jgi:hypothetical protein
LKKKSTINEIALKNVKIKDFAKRKLENEVRELTLNIFQLKVYDIILRLDEFRNEEILPANGKGDRCIN